jgi:hypothetical protein
MILIFFKDPIYFPYYPSKCLHNEFILPMIFHQLVECILYNQCFIYTYFIKIFNFSGFFPLSFNYCRKVPTARLFDFCVLLKFNI